MAGEDPGGRKDKDRVDLCLICGMLTLRGSASKHGDGADTLQLGVTRVSRHSQQMNYAFSANYCKEGMRSMVDGAFVRLDWCSEVIY